MTFVFKKDLFLENQIILQNVFFNSEIQKIYDDNLRYLNGPAIYNDHTVSLSFGDYKYTETTQHPKMSLSVLISSIGGSLGLFIGIRFLSLVELLEFIVEIFNIIAANRIHVI